MFVLLLRRRLASVLLLVSCTSIGHVGAVDSPVTAGSEIVSFPHVVIIRCFIYRISIVLQPLPDECKALQFNRLACVHQIKKLGHTYNPEGIASTHFEKSRLRCRQCPSFNVRQKDNYIPKMLLRAQSRCVTEEMRRKPRPDVMAEGAWTTRWSAKKSSEVNRQRNSNVDSRIDTQLSTEHLPLLLILGLK